MRESLTIALLLIATAVTASAQEVVAHRGYHAKASGAHNSIEAFKEAEKSGFTHIEFDIVRTAEGRRIVAHGPKHGEMTISESTLDSLRHEPLVNGEPLPTLEEYLDMATLYPATHLVVEIKCDSEAEERLSCDIVVEELEQRELLARSTFISFSPLICDILSSKGYPTLYLKGDMKPREAAKRGYKGINYHIGVYRKRPGWIGKAHRRDMVVGVWTVNEESDAEWAIDKHIDLITSDNPEMVRGLIAEHEATEALTKEQRREQRKAVRAAREAEERDRREEVAERSIMA